MRCPASSCARCVCVFLHVTDKLSEHRLERGCLHSCACSAAVLCLPETLEALCTSALAAIPVQPMLCLPRQPQLRCTLYKHNVISRSHGRRTVSQTATIHATNMFLHAAQLHARTQRRRALTLPKPQCQEHKWRHAVGAASVIPSIPHPAGGRRCRRSSSAKDSSWGRASPGAAPRQPSCLRHEATTSAAVRTYATLCRTHAPSKRMSRKVASCFLL